MPGVRRGQRPLSAHELARSPHRLTGLASSRLYEAIVLWRSYRGRLYELYAPDDTDDLRSSERSRVGEPTDPSIAYGLVPGHMLATLAFIAWNLRCRLTDVEANPNSSTGSRDDNAGRLDISIEAQRKAGRRIEFLFKKIAGSQTRSSREAKC